MRCYRKRRLIAGRKQLAFFVHPSAIHRSYCVDHIFCRELEAGSDLCLAGLTSFECSTGPQQIWPGGTVDRTVHTTSSGGSGTATLIDDDNQPAITATNAKLRLVNGVGGLASGITLTADYSAVATDIAANTASTPASLTAGSAMRLEATTPSAASSLFLDDAVTLVAGKVYTLFMLGDANAPTGVLRRDR